MLFMVYIDKVKNINSLALGLPQTLPPHTTGIVKDFKAKLVYHPFSETLMLCYAPQIFFSLHLFAHSIGFLTATTSVRVLHCMAIATLAPGKTQQFSVHFIVLYNSY